MYRDTLLMKAARRIQNCNLCIENLILQYKWRKRYHMLHRIDRIQEWRMTPWRLRYPHELQMPNFPDYRMKGQYLRFLLWKELPQNLGGGSGLAKIVAVQCSHSSKRDSFCTQIKRHERLIVSALEKRRSYIESQGGPRNPWYTVCVISRWYNLSNIHSLS